MTSKEAIALYAGKYFYEIVDGNHCGEPCKMLFGPHDNIYYANKDARSAFKQFSTDAEPQPEWAFVQVVDGKPTMAFTKEQILVTDRVL